LERFVEGFDGGGLALLPNFTYSLALARYWSEQKQQQAGGSSSGTSAADRPSTSTAAAAADGGDDEGDDAIHQPKQTSRDTLVSAMLLHPLVVPQLMARLQGQGVGKDAHWKSLLERRLFGQATAGGSATLGHLVALFVERSHLLWKAQDVQVGLGCWLCVFCVLRLRVLAVINQTKKPQI